MARLYIPINHRTITPIHFLGINSGYPFHRALLSLDELLECAVERRADVRDILPEVDGGESPLRDTRGGEFEFLLGVLAFSIMGDIVENGKLTL